MAATPKSRRYPSYGLDGPVNVRIGQGLQDGLFTGAAREVAAAINADWHRTAWAPAARLVEAAGCDKAMLSRFIRQIGYESHAEFQRAALSIIKVSQEAFLSEEPAAGDDFPQTEWLKQRLASLSQGQRVYIDALPPKDYEEFADQVKHIAWLLGRAQRILIAAATPGALMFLSTVAAIFGAIPTIPVSIVENSDEDPRLGDGDHLVLLHVSDFDRGDELQEASMFDWAHPDFSKVKQVHVVVNGDAVTRTGFRRVLELHDGSDPIAAISVMINICCVMVQEMQVPSTKQFSDDNLR